MRRFARFTQPGKARFAQEGSSIVIGPESPLAWQAKLAAAPECRPSWMTLFAALGLAFVEALRVGSGSLGEMLQSGVGPVDGVVQGSHSR